MKREKEISGTSRQAEEDYLLDTIAIVHTNLDNYGREVARMKADIDEMLEHYHDNDAEVWTILNNTITLHDHMERALIRNEKARNKPYFGRIVFWDETFKRQESIYIGKGGIARDTTHQMVVDWRAPVANAYYENGLGKCSYPAPDGEQILIDLKLKRTYEIEDGKLLDFYDTEVVANDDLLTKYLAKNKQAVLGEIIATIQKEQNDIIRKSPYHNIIVQGVAGSGKTTVAMHRISYILYNYQERFRPEDFYIVGSNRILLEYITGVLPDLDVYGIRQMTMEQLFVRLLYEEWDEKKYQILVAEKMGQKESIKGTLQWFHDLEEYCRKLEWDLIPRESVFLNRRQFVEGIRNGKTGVFDETDGEQAFPEDLTELLSRETIERYIRQSPTISVQSKINMLNDRLLNKIKDHFLGKGITYAESERKAVLKAYRGRFGARVWKRSIFVLYQDFLAKQTEKGYDVKIPKTAFTVYDLAALAYLYKRVKETEVISEAHHVVIDEAQDFGMMAYSVLKFCIRDCTYTVMGDVSQNIHFGYGLNDWEELKELLLTDKMDSFGVLKKSYRNTVEISEFAMNILHHGQFSIYPAQPIIRHGDPVQLLQVSDREALLGKAAEVCKSWQQKGLDTIAVICRNMEEAKKTAKDLGKLTDVMECDLEKAVFGSGIMVLPVEYTKGLEFDAVLVLDPDRKAYPVDDGHAKLLYVAATRALHELCVLYIKNLTGLIADPLPERKVQEKKRLMWEFSNSKKQQPTAQSLSAGITGTAGIEKPAAGAAEIRSLATGTAETKNPSAAGAAATATEKSVTETAKSRKLKGAAAAEKSAAETAKTRKLAAGTAAAKKPAAETAGNRKPSAGTAGNRKPAIGTVEIIRPAFSMERMKKVMLESSKGQEKQSAGNEKNVFGDMPPTEGLRPAGHGKIDLSVRWVMKQPDGLYIQSRYGVLRFSPVGSAIIRITFTKGQQPAMAANSKIVVNRVEKTWMYRETGSAVELMTDELCLRVDKTTGAVSYLTRDKKLLLSERQRESRQIEEAGGKTKTWLFLEWKKEEKLYGMEDLDKAGMSLRSSARYISHGSNADKLPLLLSDKGYGILMATDGPAICCDVPAYGSYLSTEKEAQMDYYFIAGRQQKTILNAYAYLCGKH